MLGASQVRHIAPEALVVSLDIALSYIVWGIPVPCCWFRAFESVFQDDQLCASAGPGDVILALVAPWIVAGLALI